ncbi:NAD(P)-dependent oxidoreductase [Cyanobacteria bacterium FACHB-502]|uniref:SDR family oxidoreductase n=1 Tax=Leptolyngbya sp. GB1-A1 TaxID=2933908 RepID=UPI001985057F|nr:NAD(P)-dependent oxidoreductase [Cyanobacteria bacterium FACHB-502]
MQKLLITGASGFLGWYLCQAAQTDWEVYGTHHRQAVNLAKVHSLPIDLTDLDALKSLFATVRPDAVIHAAAVSRPNDCQDDPVRSYQTNVVASCNIAERCEAAGIPCVFTSSELVFDGLNPPYREGDPVSPINLYGEQKVAAELGMLDRCSQMLVCRMPLMFGNVPHAESFLQPFIQRLRSGERLNVFVDEFRTPVSGEDAAKGILQIMDKVRGRVHLGGKERLSRYKFGQHLVAALDLPETMLNPCRQADVPMSAPRAPDVSLDSSLAFSLGYNPTPVKEALARLLHPAEE